ncbi:hypothetical protein CR152_24735 [Massilia violaceinigra]|uniref:Uncharacterized protein n=1 Tax=Massilia violaceinigra TaxID=2045208 RepID=A0A2D2DQV2_9BURK|nr:hypothetical protein [Massilia violaceinigra]ATQ77352.1 hypothetical protein CR152_24735 [Massilia violaceinigra]
MNPWFLSGSILMIIVGVVHSVFGERLIFSRLRAGGLIPTDGGSHLLERHVRILWATWHLSSVLGWAAAFILLYASNAAVPALVIDALVVAAAAGGMLVLVGTHGKHPGWIALLIVALLVWYG